MNAWGQLSLAEVATTGLFASDDALRDEEYLVALADEIRYKALPMARKVEADAEAYWHDFEYAAVSGYVESRMARLDDSIKLAHQMTLDLCAGRLSKTEQGWLRGLNRGLDRRRAEHRQQRAAELRAAVAAWETAALARLGKRTVTAEVAAESMPIAA
jgi:hypothetical protein